MSEYLARLQEDRRVSYGILGVAAALAVLVGLVAINKFAVNETSVAASSGNPVAEENADSDEAVDIPSVDIEQDGPASPQTADEPPATEPEPEEVEASEAVALGIATTTTTPPTTVAPSTEPDAKADAPAEPPTPGEGEEGFVDTGNGVLVPPVLLKIRFCESTDNYKAKNPNSTAAGGYQFLTGSWAGYGHATKYGVSTADQATPAQQDQAALDTWRVAGTRPWNASKSCWSKR